MLEITNLTKKYPQFTLNCSLTVKPGTITGLIGQNGSGKTTTFKAILGLVKIDSGDISIFNKNINLLTNEDKQYIGALLADSGFSGYLTINDIIPILKNMYQHFDSNRFISLCQQFDLPLNKPIKEFSLGMKTKLKVIIACNHQAKLLILDEPTSTLDVIARDEILDLLRDYILEDESRSILISSHISKDLESLCDDLYMIDQGKIIFHEETDILLSNYAILKVDLQQFNKLDHRYLLKIKKESYGYRCLTDQKQYYLDNYPNIVIENSSIDDLILMMIRGESL